MLRAGRARTAAAVVVANTVQKPSLVFIIAVVVPRAHDCPVETFVVDRRLPQNF